MSQVRMHPEMWAAIVRIISQREIDFGRQTADLAEAVANARERLRDLEQELQDRIYHTLKYNSIPE